MIDKKPLYLSKTLWFNVLTIALTVLEMVADLPFLTPEYAQIILIVVAAVNVGLRLLTSQPVTEAGVEKARAIRRERSRGDV